jgi:hypothetical protein
MTRKKVAIINLVEKIQLLKAAGIQIPPPKILYYLMTKAKKYPYNLYPKEFNTF